MNKNISQYKSYSDEKKNFEEKINELNKNLEIKINEINDYKIRNEDLNKTNENLVLQIKKYKLEINNLEKDKKEAFAKADINKEFLEEIKKENDILKEKINKEKVQYDILKNEIKNKKIKILYSLQIQEKNTISENSENAMNNNIFGKNNFNYKEINI